MAVEWLTGWVVEIIIKYVGDPKEQDCEYLHPRLDRGIKRVQSHQRIFYGKYEYK